MAGTLGVIIAAAALVVAFMSQKQKEQFVYWLRHLVMYPIYWYRYHKFWYCTKIYFVKRKQSNEHAYVYVGKRRKLFCDIRWKFSEWFEVICIKLKRTESIVSKAVDPDELGVIQVLAIYRSQNQQWEKIPPLYRERWGTTFDVLDNLEFVRSPLPRYYNPETGENQWERYHAWHKPVIDLLPHQSRLCRSMKIKLKDFKKKYKLCFICKRDARNPSKGQVNWKWKRRET